MTSTPLIGSFMNNLCLDLQVHHYQAIQDGYPQAFFSNPAAAASYLLFRRMDCNQSSIRNTKTNEVYPEISFHQILLEATPKRHA